MKIDVPGSEIYGSLPVFYAAKPDVICSAVYLTLPSRSQNVSRAVLGSAKEGASTLYALLRARFIRIEGV